MDVNRAADLYTQGWTLHQIGVELGVPWTVAITFGDTPVPIPAPFAQLLLEHIENRPNQRNGNRDSDWLFPSSRAGRHIQTRSWTGSINSASASSAPETARSETSSARYLHRSSQDYSARATK